VDIVFEALAGNTKGTLTYYYLIAPEISSTAKGYWYHRDWKRENSFVRNLIPDIEKADPDDLEGFGWYLLPKSTGKAQWVEPYYNQNMGLKMISYVVPVYYHNRFIGVIGMDFSYNDLIGRMEEIDEFETGYAFLTNRDGAIIYHKDVKEGTTIEEAGPAELRNLSPDNDHIVVRYEYNGIMKRAAIVNLSNNMRLYLTVSESELNDRWKKLTGVIISFTLILIMVFIFITSFAVDRITNPLTNLANAAAEIETGNYNVDLDYDREDEIGLLTRSFRHLVRHLESYIGNLNEMAFKDPLTSLRNKTAFDSYCSKLDENLKDTTDGLAFCVFDCNSLKEINDNFGHAKGDKYLRTASQLICKVFRHSPVFRIGGDEFAAILQNEDYDNRKALWEEFDRMSEEICSSAEHPWDETNVAKGMAIYDPESDRTTADLIKRADTEMYKDKRRMKSRY
jgi:diguanylate cyclase (GGDEF)-like protein